jgi:hypothetical protein
MEVVAVTTFFHQFTVRGGHGIDREAWCIGVFVGRDLWAMRYHESGGRDG